jgi:hypothetical protein
MKKFSISLLESARRNPILFSKSLKEGSSVSNQFGGGRPISVRWLDAVGNYHRTRDISLAITSLEKAFINRKDTPRNRKEVENLIFALENYVIEYNRLGYEHLEKAHSMQIILSPKVKITGWIWLLNMTSLGGRSGFIITKGIIDTSWQTELKYPIIQDYIANHIYGCELNQVAVGVIDYTSGHHSYYSYSKKEIDEALAELNSIGQNITSLL